MSEKTPHDNSEQAHSPKQYLIPVMGGKVVWAVLNERKQRIYKTKQRGGDASVRTIEAHYPTGAVDEEGQPITETAMIADFHLTESSQEELMKRYLKATNETNEGEERA
jgi:hypothetical protein